MPVLNPRISAVREDSRVCDQRSAVSAQPLNLRNFRLAEGHPRCPTGEFVTNRKLIALQKLPRKLLVLREGPDLTARFFARSQSCGSGLPGAAPRSPQPVSDPLERASAALPR